MQSIPTPSSAKGSYDRAPVRAGDLLCGRYEVEALLGTGGVGIVVLAKHIRLNERVAIKFLRGEAMENPELVARFAQEARAAVKMKGEHVARVIDVDALADGTPFMVMEYLEGQDLARELNVRGALSVEEAVEYTLHVCEALAEAHSVGIVHRDIKPANLFLLRREGTWPAIKVLDFGISKLQLAGAAGEPLATTQLLMGSPIYMSPEQIRGARAVDHRSDLWSLGIVLYEMLTNGLPFLGNTVTELAAAILEAPVPSIRDQRADVPRELDAIVLRCLEKHVTARFENAAELAYALAPFAPRRAHVCADRAHLLLQKVGGSLPPMASSFPPGPGSLSPVPGSGRSATDPSWGGAEPIAHRSSAATKVAVLAATAAFLALVGAGVAWQRQGSVSKLDAPSAADPFAAEEHVTPPIAPVQSNVPAQREVAAPTAATPPPIATSAPVTQHASRTAAPPPRRVAPPPKETAQPVLSKPSAVSVDIGY